VHVMVVSAISRESSSCYMLAAHLADLCRARDVDVDFVTPANVGVPPNDGTVADDLPEARAWQERVAKAHCHIWVSPEYHSGMTGAMKNLLDYLPKEPMAGDVIGLVALAGGAMAALNTLNGMAIIARSLGAWVAPELCALSSNEVKAGLDPRTLGRVEAMVDSVIDMGRRLNSPPPSADVPFT
jgi:azobenzene reductase